MGINIIPNLHDDAARQCLMRLPYDQFVNMASVSPRWQGEIENPFFHSVRRKMGVTQPIIVMLQDRIKDMDMERFSVKSSSRPDNYQLSLFNLKTCLWSDIPPVPELPNGFPPCCRLAGVGTELVVIGGSDPTSYAIVDSVFIYNFISGKWRLGAQMPGGKKLHFGCASDTERMVYVAGGVNELLIPTKTVMAYDVIKDEWIQIPDMTKARIPSMVCFREGKLHVIEDDGINVGGLIKREVEVFDVCKSNWESLVSEDTGMGIYVDGNDKGIYKCVDSKLMIREGIIWKVLFKLPETMNIHYATVWQRKLIVVGRTGRGLNSIKACALDLKTYSWKELDGLPENADHVQTGTYVEI